MYHAKTIRIFGFSLIELMIVITIIGILATIAVPQYSNYVRKSRTSEAMANVNSIAQYEEQYYSENNRYASAGPNPATVPYPGDPGGVLPFNTSDAQWTELGAIFTNNTQLRFQYRAFAGQFNSTGGSVTTTGFYAWNANLGLGSAATSGGQVCASLGTPTPNAQYFGISQVNNANWFVITAIGNQVEDTTCSLFVKVNDRPAVYTQNDAQ
jgi:prepilin-type N-terminal cleavage/methylation domain-containing protein